MNSEVNTLFLDEPTNHLDILTKEWIEDAIDDFNETMIFVSHDRYFINRFATRIWSFENGQIEDYIGTYEEYQQARARRAAQRQSGPQEKTPARPAAKPQNPRRDSREERRRRRELERQIAAGEERLEELDLLMAQCGSDHVRLAELFEEKERLENQLLELYDQQEKLDAETEDP